MSNDNNTGDVTIITHTGVFHADEVIACAMMQALFGRENVFILRCTDDDVNNIKIPAPIMDRRDVHYVDIGGRYDISKPEGAKYLDHHQDKALPCAAVLVRDYLAGLGHDMSWTDCFMSGVDKQDRGIEWSPKGTQSLSDLVRSFNCPDMADPDRQDSRFRQVVELLRQHFLVLIEDNKAVKEFQAYVRSKLGSDIVLLERSGPGASMIATENPISKLVINPGTRGGWAVHRVEDNVPGRRDRVARATLDRGICEAFGASFYHANGFMAVFPEKEKAIEAARKCIEDFPVQPTPLV